MKQKKEGGRVFRGYCVKYALTTGIVEADYELSEDGKRAYQVGKPIFNGMRVGQDVFENKDKAIAAAKKMAAKKYESLGKQREAMKQLMLEPKWFK